MSDRISGKMAAMKPAIRNITLFIIARYPFINALSFIMLLAERSQRESYPFMEPNLIYAHVIVSIFAGVCMSFNMKRKELSMITAGQLLYFAYNLYVNEKMLYRRWVVVRMSSRLVGTAGIIMLYSFFTMPKPRSQHLRRIGETLLGVWLVCLTYALVESREDRSAFTNFMPFSEATLYVWVVVYGVCALCFISAMFVHDVTQVLVIFLWINTMVIDCRINYWTTRWGMDLWNQIRVLSDNITIILGLAMYLSCTKKRIYTKED